MTGGRAGVAGEVETAVVEMDRHCFSWGRGL